MAHLFLKLCYSIYIKKVENEIIQILFKRAIAAERNVVCIVPIFLFGEWDLARAV